MKEVFIKSVKDQIPATLLNNFQLKLNEENIAFEINQHFKRVEDDELAKGYCNHCNIPGTSWEEYKNILVEVDGHSFMCGIRFENMNIDRPFVEIVLQEKMIDSVETIEKLGKAIKERYKNFNVNKMRIFFSGQDQNFLKDYPRASKWKVILANRIDTLRSAKATPNQTVSLEKCNNLDFYNDYDSLYQRYYSATPAMKEWARIESKDSLNDYFEEGLLFNIKYNGKWSGIIAGLNSNCLSFPGICVGEFVVDEKIRGKNQSSYIQNEFLNSIDVPGNYLFWGTIHADNKAAIRSAEKFNRVTLGSYWWIQL